LTGTRVQRRLAAVLAADVAGYSRLMGADEEGTLARLKSLRKTLVDPAIADHRGRIVKTTGDGILVEFASAVDAAKGAAELQRSMATENTDVPPEERIDFRIGIHVGDIIVDETDIFGEGVNIAARLEAIAEPGGICISDDAQRQIRGKINLTFEDMGPQPLKNIAEPIRAWQLKIDKTAPSTARHQAVELALPDKPSIAVLPFQNMSGDPEQEYFADGVVEEIITALSRFKMLFVIARNSSFTYKGKPVDVKQVGRELGVRYVLEGSVRKAGNKIRITGQLIDAATGAHLWADRFNGGLEDIFDLQDQVTANVVGAIAPEIEQAEIERIKRKSTNNLDAYDYFLQGMASFNLSTAEGIENSLKNFHKAIELDPNFATACGWATIAYARRKQGLWMTDVNVETAEGMRLARRAIELGKDDAVALATGGFGLAFLGGELDAGLALTDRALALNPNFAAAWMGSGWIRAYVGDPDTAVRHLSHAMRLSPRDLNITQIYMAMSLAMRCAERYDEAALWATKVLQEHPRYVAAILNYAIATALAGRVEEARVALSRAMQIDPTLRISKLPLLSVLRRPEDRSRYAEGARLAGMPE
jgi:TolB-like protein/class 3 adenylate cyclase